MSLFGRQLDDAMISQAALPVGCGGLGLNIDSTEYCHQQYHDSLAITESLVWHIVYGEPRSFNNDIRSKIRDKKKTYWKSKCNVHEENLNAVDSKRFEELKLPGANCWINCLPVKWKPNLILPKNEFRDALLLRFNKMPENIPMICPALSCHEPFSLTHIDICSKGGVIHRRHDYIKFIIGMHAEKAFGTNSVEIEPMIRYLDDEANDIVAGNLNRNARADLAIRDFEGMHQTSYFDVSIVSPICDTNLQNTVLKTIANAEKKKNDLYNDRITKQLGGKFMPCIFSSGGGIGPAAKKIIDKISNKIAYTSMERLSDIKSEIRTDIVVSLIKSRIQGLRSSRKSLLSQMN